MKDVLADTIPPGPASQPRAKGSVRVSAKLSDTKSVIDTLYQSGSAKVLLPRTGTMDLQAVLLNTAGGITGGDAFSYQAAATPGSALTLSTQAAERAYRAQPGQTGRVDVTLSVAAGARLAWLPQETILFDGACLDRRLDAELAEDSHFLAVEPVIFGRTAMGERLDELAFRDRWTVRRNGDLIFADALRIDGDGEAVLARPAALNGHRAMASIVLATSEAEKYLAPLRDALGDTGGASLVRDGVLAARLTAPDGFSLRKTLIPALEILTGDGLPQVWKL